jgi:hypothetical protein
MNKITHAFYIGIMTLIVVVVTAWLAYTGYSYFSLPLEERFYHLQYNWFKPSGILGQGLGIIGTFLILFGVVFYIARKRFGFLGRFIRLKYALEFHIFLCVLGPVLILFHTTFKFGGIVSIAFWSMTAVVLSGVIGRFIYIQIPRSIGGRALSLAEVNEAKESLAENLKNVAGLEQSTLDSILGVDGESGTVDNYTKRKKLASIRHELKQADIDRKARKKILGTVRRQMALASKMKRLKRMQNLFKYWHIVHMPFAIIMLVIVIIHIVITVSLGYKWIF